MNQTKKITITWIFVSKDTPAEELPKGEVLARNDRGEYIVGTLKKFVDPQSVPTIYCVGNGNAIHDVTAYTELSGLFEEDPRCIFLKNIEKLKKIFPEFDFLYGREGYLGDDLCKWICYCSSLLFPPAISKIMERALFETTTTSTYIDDIVYLNLTKRATRECWFIKKKTGDLQDFLNPVDVEGICRYVGKEAPKIIEELYKT